jgi:hypothetical protein
VSLNLDHVSAAADQRTRKKDIEAMVASLRPMDRSEHQLSVGFAVDQ